MVWSFVFTPKALPVFCGLAFTCFGSIIDLGFTVRAQQRCVRVMRLIYADKTKLLSYTILRADCGHPHEIYIVETPLIYEVDLPNT